MKPVNETIKWLLSQSVIITKLNAQLQVHMKKEVDLPKSWDQKILIDKQNNYPPCHFNLENDRMLFKKIRQIFIFSKHLVKIRTASNTPKSKCKYMSLTRILTDKISLVWSSESKRVPKFNNVGYDP